MTEQLRRISVRLRRAEAHAYDFNRRLGEFKKAGSYGFTREPNLDGSEHVYKVKAPDYVFETLSTLASDSLHNARAALDNLVWRLAELNLRRCGKAIPLDYKGHAFPICLNLDEYSQVWRDALSGTSREAKRLVRRFQPYVRSNPANADPLWTLRQLQNIDKHRFLVRLVVDIANFKWTAYPSPGEAPMTTTRLAVYNLVPDTTVEFVAGPGFHASQTGAGIEDGDEFCRFLVDPPNRELDLNVEPTILVLLDEGPGEGQPMPAALGLMLSRVREVIEDAKALPECR